MNALDIVIFAVIAIAAFWGYRRGLLRTVYRLVSFFVAAFLARQFYFPVARWLRESELYDIVQEGIAQAINLEALVAQHGAGAIDNLPIPGALQGLLHTNNNSNMFELLQVHTLEEYIAGFFANMVMNGLGILLVFVLALLALAVVGKLLDIISVLPVIGTINSVAGLLFGVIVSLIIIWVSLIFCGLFVIAVYPEVQPILDNSWVAQRLFEITLPQLARVV